MTTTKKCDKCGIETENPRLCDHQLVCGRCYRYKKGLSNIGMTPGVSLEIHKIRYFTLNMPLSLFNFLENRIKTLKINAPAYIRELIILDKEKTEQEEKIKREADNNEQQRDR